MSGLADGKIGNTIITKDSKIDDFKNNPKYRVFDCGRGNISIELIESIVLLGYEFYVEVYFLENKIKIVELVPIVKNYKIPSFPTKEYEAKKWEICKAFLIDELGMPLISMEKKIEYQFNWGEVYSYIVSKGRDPYTGGDIYIRYTK